MYHFDNGSGVTADSLSYYRDNRHLLGDIIEARVHFPGSGGPYPYCFERRDHSGNHMWLSGLTAGYSGEGPRGALSVLVDAGFLAEAAERVFRDQRLTLGPEELAPCGTSEQASCAIDAVLSAPDLDDGFGRWR